VFVSPCPVCANRIGVSVLFWPMPLIHVAGRQCMSGVSETAATARSRSIVVAVVVLGLALSEGVLDQTAVALRQPASGHHAQAPLC
jgi:hypothetical protein